MTTENKKHAVSRRNFVKGTLRGRRCWCWLARRRFHVRLCSEGRRGKTPAQLRRNHRMEPVQRELRRQLRIPVALQRRQSRLHESDSTGDINLQARACLRGRSMRRWLNSPDRLLYPMKRVGKRGEGKFEQISWDEAIQTIADKLKYTIDTYGNDAIYVNYATGMYSATGNPSSRLLNLLGGYPEAQLHYSTNMLSAALPFLYW